MAGMRIILSIYFAAISAILISCNSNYTSSDQSKESLKTRADLAVEQEVQMTMDPHLGFVPRERIWTAYEEMKRQQEELYGKLGKAGIPGITWEERGPKNVGGRTRALIFDLNDATHKTVWAGSVGGGLWKTNDIYSTSISWTPVNDLLENLAVTTIAQHPQKHDTMYFGTGEGFYNSDAIRGDGIFRSFNGGTTWKQLLATKDSTSNTFNYVQKIVIAENGDVFAATRDGGIQKSTDNGNTWAQVLGTSSITTTNRASDIEIAANGDLYASFGIFNSDGIYKSVNGGIKWNKKSISPSSGYRIEIACAPSNFKYVYAIIQSTSTDGVGDMIWSSDSGASWSTMNSVSWKDQCFGSSSSDFSRGQAWYDLLLAVDPNDEGVVTVGGVDMFRTTDTGSTWIQVSTWTGCAFEDVHADHHIMVFSPGSSDKAIFGNDGGVYVTENMTSGSRTISNQGTNYNTTQYYACAIHPTKSSNHYLAGAQDNGTQRYSTLGINATVEEVGGDGAFCHINQITPDTQLAAYTRNNVRISTNGGFSFSTLSGSENVGNFINQSDYDDVNSILYSARGNNQVKRWKNIGGTVSVSTLSSTTLGSRQVSAVTISPENPQSVLVGTEGGRVVKITGANGGNPTFTNISSGLPSGNITCIAIQNGDSNHMLATYSNYGLAGNVYRTTNGGSSWSNIQGDLPEMPVRWIMFSPVSNTAALIATELGVWSCGNITAGSIDWDPNNATLANVRVDMLQWRESDSTIIAATHGRGLYSTTSFSTAVEPGFSADVLQVYEGDSIHFTNTSLGSTSYAWDFDNDGVYESTEKDPYFAYSDWGTFSVKLRINGLTGDSLTKSSYITVLPRLGTPYYKTEGGDMESNPGHFAGTLINGDSILWERGAPSSNYFSGSDYNGSFAWVTALNADYGRPSTYTDLALLTPSFNMSKSGTYRLSFWKSMEILYCNGPFAVQVQSSTDKGTTWTRVGDYGNGYHWYNRGSATCGTCCINSSIFSDNTGWTGSYSLDSSSYDVSSLAGNEDVRFRVMASIHPYFSSSNGYTNDGFLVDDFSLTGPANDSIKGGGIETIISSRTLQLGPEDTASFYSNNGKLIASIINEDNVHDFGEVKVEIDNAGTGVMTFDGKTANYTKIFQKTLKITPENTSTSADVKISMYFTKAELDAWKSATGLKAKDLQLFKTTKAITESVTSDGIYPTSTVVDSTYLGENLCITSSFTNGFSGVGAGGGGDGFGGPLPVSWLNFDGQRFPTTVILNWSTASELNNERFDIFRKIGAQDFEKIGSVVGRGTSNSINRYKYFDGEVTPYSRNPLCYRIEQIDFDGQTSTSRIICLQPGQTNADVIVGPNPVEDILEIRIDPWKINSYEVELVDLKGNVLIRGDVSSENRKMDVSRLSSGTYFAIIRSEGYVLAKKKILVL